jgi:AcrR family transcriptional regulator
MPHRSYKLGRRGESAEETRQRIVEATFALHSEQGIAATSMKQIASRAGVSVGAVYHHFPTYEDAIHACGVHSDRVAPPPSHAIFDGLPGPEARIRRLVQEAFDWFDRNPAFEHLRRDQVRMPVLRPFAEEEEQNRLALMTEALRSLKLGEDHARIATALTDVAVYRCLRRSGHSPQAAAREIADVILSWIYRHQSSAE